MIDESMKIIQCANDKLVENICKENAVDYDFLMKDKVTEEEKIKVAMLVKKELVGVIQDVTPYTTNEKALAIFKKLQNERGIIINLSKDMQRRIYNTLISNTEYKSKPLFLQMDYLEYMINNYGLPNDKDELIDLFFMVQYENKKDKLKEEYGLDFNDKNTLIKYLNDKAKESAYDNFINEKINKNFPSNFDDETEAKMDYEYAVLKKIEPYEIEKDTLINYYKIYIKLKDISLIDYMKIYNDNYRIYESEVKEKIDLLETKQLGEMKLKCGLKIKLGYGNRTITLHYYDNRNDEAVTDNGSYSLDYIMNDIKNYQLADNYNLMNKISGKEEVLHGSSISQYLEFCAKVKAKGFTEKKEVVHFAYGRGVITELEVNDHLEVKLNISTPKGENKSISRYTLITTKIFGEELCHEDGFEEGDFVVLKENRQRAVIIEKKSDTEFDVLNSDGIEKILNIDDIDFLNEKEIEVYLYK